MASQEVATSELSPSIIGHGQVTLGVTAPTVSIVDKSVRGLHGVLIKADPGNSGICYIGKSGVATTTGFPLSAGQSQFFELDDVNSIYAIGSASSQKLAWIVY